MKKTTFIALIAVVLTGCNDTVEKLASFSKPQLRDSESSEGLHELDLPATNDTPVSSTGRDHANTEKFEFPTERTITDANGRSIEARILAKKGDMLAIARLPSNQQFILPLDKLAAADRASLSSIRDGGQFEAVETAANSVEMPANRTAMWHSQVTNAEKEATQLGIPLLVAVLINGSSSATDMEKSLVYSREFKTWADRNVALCMIRTDGFSGTQSRQGTYETWLSLQKYGIAQSSESYAVLIDPEKFTSARIAAGGLSSGTASISKLEFVIRDQAGWETIAAAQSPVRAASPFRVASPIVSGAT